MESTANLMIFYGIRRIFDKFHGKQQNAMANLETGLMLPEKSANLISSTNINMFLEVEGCILNLRHYAVLL